MLEVTNGLDLKVSKNRHIAPILMKREKDKKHNSCEYSHNFHTVSFLDMHSTICIMQ